MNRIEKRARIRSRAIDRKWSPRLRQIRRPMSYVATFRPVVSAVSSSNSTDANDSEEWNQIVIVGWGNATSFDVYHVYLNGREQDIEQWFTDGPNPFRDLELFVVNDVSIFLPARALADLTSSSLGL